MKMIPPRIRVVPPVYETIGDEMIEVAGELGFVPDRWQELCFKDIGLVADDRPAAREAVVSASRQNGKTMVGIVCAATWAAQGLRVLYSAHAYATAREAHRVLLHRLPENWGTKATAAHGDEAIRFRTGGEIIFRTRTAGGLRGFSIDRLILDEAQILDTAEVRAIVPTYRARESKRSILYLMTAGNAIDNPNCAVAYELRQRALRGDAKAFVFDEWSAPCVDEEQNEIAADEIPESMLNDEAMWVAATPSIESGRITIEGLKEDREDRDDITWAVEYLNCWIAPNASIAGTGPIGVSAMADLGEEGSRIDDAEGARVVVGFDASPEGLVSLEVAGQRRDRLFHLDHDGSYRPAAAAAKIRKMMGAESGSIFLEPGAVDVVAIAYDATPANRAFAEELLRGEHAVLEGDLREGDAWQACESLRTAVEEQRFRHTGQAAFVDGIARGRVKRTDRGWMFDRNASAKLRVDVSPLIAGAMALSVAQNELADGGKVEILGWI